MKEENSCSYFIRNIAHTIKCMQDKCLVHYGLTNQQARLLGEITRLSGKKKIFGRRDLEKLYAEKKINMLWSIALTLIFLYLHIKLYRKKEYFELL